MAYFRIPVLLIALVLSACGNSSDSSNSPAVQSLTALTNWYVTSPDIDLSLYTTAVIRTTLSNDTMANMTFNTTPHFQLWSHPDIYDFVGMGDVAINSEPTGTIMPGETFSYDLTIDLTNMPANQVHMAFRPDATIPGTLMPTEAGLVSAEVILTP